MILVGLAIGALFILVIGVFVLLIIGVQSTDRRKSLCNVSDSNTARSFARRVLGVYVRQSVCPPDRDEVRK